MNRNTTIVLVLVAAALGLYVLLVQLPKDKAAAEATGTPSTQSTLWTVAAEQVTGLRVVDRALGSEMALVKDAGGAWALTTPAGEVTDQAAAAAAISSLTSLSVASTITAAADLAAYGVLSPTYTIEVSLADGSKLKASVGDKTPTGSSYYVLREGAADVVVISSFSLEALTGLAAKPPIAPPTPTETVGPGTGTPTAGPGTETPTVGPGTAQATEATSAATPAGTATSAAPSATVGVTKTATVAVTATTVAATATSVAATATPTP